MQGCRPTQLTVQEPEEDRYDPRPKVPEPLVTGQRLFLGDFGTQDGWDGWR